MSALKTRFEKVLSEHEELRRNIADLREFLQEPRPEIGQVGFHRWSTALAETFVGLHAKVFRHFREEEEGGLLEELVEQHPRAAHVVEVLVSEHGQILENMRDILADTMAYSGRKQPEKPYLRRRTLSVLDLLSDHERKETDLIQQLLYEDLGTKD